jgi:hypothetical protein
MATDSTTGSAGGIAGLSLQKKLVFSTALSQLMEPLINESNRVDDEEDPNGADYVDKKLANILAEKISGVDPSKFGKQ